MSSYSSNKMWMFQILNWIKAWAFPNVIGFLLHTYKLSINLSFIEVWLYIFSKICSRPLTPVLPSFAPISPNTSHLGSRWMAGHSNLERACLPPKLNKDGLLKRAKGSFLLGISSLQLHGCCSLSCSLCRQHPGTSVFFHTKCIWTYSCLFNT